MIAQNNFSFIEIRNNMISLCKNKKINATYNTEKDHGINIPGFNLKDGQSETIVWPKAIASIYLQKKTAINTLRESSNQIQNTKKCKTTLDCSSYIQVLFLTALITTIQDDHILKSILLNLINTKENTNQELIIAPAGATTNNKNSKAMQGFLYEMENYLDIHTIDTKCDIKHIIDDYNLKEGDIIYIENHKDYEKWNPNGAWSGEWCLLTSITEKKIKVFGFGPGELSYKKMVSKMAKNAYKEKKTFDDNILGKINECIIKDNSDKELENFIANNNNLTHILNNSILTNVDKAASIIKNINSKHNSKLNIFKKALKSTKKQSKFATKHNGPKSIFKKNIYISEIIQFNDSKINTLFLEHTHDL